MVRNGFEGASSQTRSAPSGGGPVWSNSTQRSPQRSSSRKRTLVPKYAPSAIAIVCPGEQNASTSAVTPPVPEGNRKARPPSSSPSSRSASTWVGWE